MQILVINPGSTSTKLSVFQNEQEICTQKIDHSVEDLKKFTAIFDQYPYRLHLIHQFLAEQGRRPQDFAVVVGRGGLYAHLGTKDVREIKKRITAGDKKAELVLNAMLYQCAKEIGAQSAVLAGQVDRIIITGGIAYDTELMAQLTEMVQFIAAVVIMPGEEEMEALALGALRVFNGQESAQIYAPEKTASENGHELYINRLQQVGISYCQTDAAKRQEGNQRPARLEYKIFIEVVSMEKSLYGAIIAVSEAIIEAESVLTELDSALGDGDCGMGLKTGFTAVTKTLEGCENESAQELLKKVAKTLISSIGGTSGALYGTAFMRMASMTGKVDTNDPKSVCEILVAGLEGAKMRGEDTKVGDKTLIDAYEPAVYAFNDIIRKDGTVGNACAAAAEAAQRGSDSTIGLIAKKGRASYLGERSIGHRDAGSYGIVVICNALAKYFA